MEEVEAGSGRGQEVGRGWVEVWAAAAVVCAQMHVLHSIDWEFPPAAPQGGTQLSGEESIQSWVLGSRTGQALGLGFTSSQTLWKLREGTQGARQALGMQL